MVKLGWHHWFAWHPVVIDGKRFWWLVVERKLRLGTSGEPKTVWDYRLPLTPIP